MASPDARAPAPSTSVYSAMIAALASAKPAAAGVWPPPANHAIGEDPERDERDADDRARRRMLVEEHDAEHRHEQRRDAAHQRIGEREVAASIGGRQRQVVAEMDRRRHCDVGPRRARRRADERQQEKADHRGAGDDQRGAEQRFAVGGLEKRVPRRVQQRRTQHRQRDAEGELGGGHAHARAAARCAGRSPGADGCRARRHQAVRGLRSAHAFASAGAAVFAAATASSVLRRVRASTPASSRIG